MNFSNRSKQYEAMEDEPPVQQTIKREKQHEKSWFNENDTIIEENTYNEYVYRVLDDNTVGMRRYLPNGSFEEIGKVPSGSYIGILSCLSFTRSHPSPILYYALSDNVKLDKYELASVDDVYKPVIKVKVEETEEERENPDAIKISILRTSNGFCILKDSTLQRIVSSNKLRHETKATNEVFISKTSEGESQSAARAFLILNGSIQNKESPTGKLYGTKYEGQIFGESLFRKEYTNDARIPRTAFSMVASETCSVLSFGLDMLSPEVMDVSESTKFKDEMRFQINEMERVNVSHENKINYRQLIEK